MVPIRTFTPDEVTRAIAGNRGLLLVHFGSPLASACEFVHQELEMLVPSFAGAIEFAEVELPLQDFDLIQTFEIEEVPTLVLFAGRREVERLERFLLPEELKDFLELSASFHGSLEVGGDLH